MKLLKNLSFLVLLCMNSNSVIADDFFNFSSEKNYELSHLSSDAYPYTIAVHKYSSEIAVKKLFISVHGYLDNCGYLKDLHRSLFKKGFDVFCLDLPGHGLSSGDVADIKEFSEYGGMLELFDFEELKKEYTEINFIAHSAGTISFLERRKKVELPFKKVILVAPLVRSLHWKKSMFLHKILKRIVKKVPRRRDGTPRFKELRAKDKHYINFTPSSWVSALKKWEKEIRDYSNTFEDKVHIIYGSHDAIVLNYYSRNVYSRIFKSPSFYEIQGATHHMDLDPKSISDTFYNKLNEVIDKKD